MRTTSWMILSNSLAGRSQMALTYGKVINSMKPKASIHSVMPSRASLAIALNFPDPTESV